MPPRCSPPPRSSYPITKRVNISLHHSACDAWWPPFFERRPPSCVLLVFGVGLCCVEPLAQKLLGLGDFRVPLAQLFGVKKLFNTFANLCAARLHFADDIGPGCVGILLNVFFDLFAGFRHCGLELFFLLVAEIEVASKLLKFGGDMLAFCTS